MGNFFRLFYHNRGKNYRLDQNSFATSKAKQPQRASSSDQPYKPELMHSSRMSDILFFSTRTYHAVTVQLFSIWDIVCCIAIAMSDEILR